MKNSKKSLLASGLSLVVSATLLMGTTFAWFTDDVKNTGNRIETGTLDVKLWNEKTEITNDSDPVFNYNLWEPGYSTEEELHVQNCGSLAVKYELELQNIEADPDLADAIYVSVMRNPADGYQELGTLAMFMEGGVFEGDDLDAGTLLPGQQSHMNFIKFTMAKEAGNDLQGKTATFDIKLKATQATYEKDGYGNDQYDADATYFGE